MNFNQQEMKEKFIKIKSQFDKDAVIFLMLLIFVLIFGSVKLLIPSVTSFGNNLKTFIEKSGDLSGMQKRLEMRKKAIQKEVTEPVKLPVKIFKSPYKDLEVENASAELVNEVISIIKNNGPNKILSLDFEKKQVKDNLGVVSKKHSILSLKIQLESSYDVIQNIINEIYLMDYLIKINKVSLGALEKYNYKRVQVYLELDLFIEI